jgi:hypothetical protein
MSPINYIYDCCFFILRLYTFISGYNDILLIPAGATNIQVREVQASNNYLGLYHSRSKITTWKTIHSLLI